MRNILKRFAESATNSNSRKPFRVARIRLTVITTLVVMFILIVFSSVIYLYFQHNVASAIQISKHSESSEHEESENEIEDRIESDTLSNLRTTLIIGNLSGILFVALASYVLARKSVAPLESSHERQIAFTNDVAHELRTPLSVLQAANESLSQENATLDEYKDVVSDSLDEIHYMKEMVNNLLVLASQDVSSQRETVVEPIDFSELVATQVKAFTPYAHEAGVELTSNMATQCFVRIDEFDARTIIGNLVKNAIDYSESGDKVVVSVDGDSKSISFVVSDSGIGIAQRDLDLIKQRFYKVDSSRKSSHSGTGLGLSIVESLVAQYGADLSIKSEIDVGTNVTVVFPASSE